MREIDLATWNRAMHCQIFRNSVQPQYCVTFELDITNFLRRIKKRGYSFTFSFVFAVTKCANEIEEFRCRFWEGKPVIYDKINTSFTYLDSGSELFKVVNVEMQDTIEEYVSLAANTVREQKEWSQEELADQMEISRQSVSKWESGASIPELDKIIRMSMIFGVSTDFLLKDEYDIDVISKNGQEGELKEAELPEISAEGD